MGTGTSLDPYDAWNIYHYVRGIMAIKVAGVLELKVNAIPPDKRKGLIAMFKRGYSNTENKQDAVFRVAKFIAASVHPPFNVGYIGKVRFTVYMSQQSTNECYDAITATQQLMERTERQVVQVVQVVQVDAKPCFPHEHSLSMRTYTQRDEEAKTAHMQDKLGAVRHILTGYLERDVARRRAALDFLNDDNGVLRGTFTGQGSKKE